MRKRIAAAPGAGKAALAAVLSASLVAGGCAETASGEQTNIFDDIALLTSSDKGLTPAQIELREQARQHAGTRITGSLLGAVLGGLGGALLADQVDVDPLTGAAVGAAGGALIGYAAGAYVSRRNEEAAGSQANLRARIAAANEDVARYEVAAQAAREVADQHAAEIRRLNAEYANQQISANDYEAQISDMKGDIRALKSLLVESEGNVQLMQRDIDELEQQGRDTSNLAAARRRLEEQNAGLRETWTALIEAVDTIAPGVDRPAVA